MKLTQDAGGWDEMIELLKTWRRDPEQFRDDDEGLKPPSLTAIDTAIRYAEERRAKVHPPPLRVVPDGEGGIEFERRTWRGTGVPGDNLVAEIITSEGYTYKQKVQLAETKSDDET